jgi:hypothetical protein
MCLREMFRFSLTWNACCYIPRKSLLISTSVKNLESRISFVAENGLVNRKRILCGERVAKQVNYPPARRTAQCFQFNLQVAT